MEFNNDFRDLLLLFNEHRVEYVIVGAYAMAHHGAPRYTGGLDIMVRISPDNAERILAALDAFGFGDVGLTAEDFLSPGRVAQLGYPPWRIDLLNTVTGVPSDEIFRNREAGTYTDVPTHYIDMESLLRNKEATGRPKDLGDIPVLRMKKELRP